MQVRVQFCSIGPILLTRVNFNLSMNMISYGQYNAGEIKQNEKRVHLGRLGMYTNFQLPFYDLCNQLFMLGSNLYHDLS